MQPSFPRFYPASAYEELARFDAGRPAGDRAPPAFYEGKFALIERFQDALLAYLTARRALGLLQPVAHSERRDVRWAAGWKAWLEGGDDLGALEHLASCVSRSLLFGDVAGGAEAYAALVSKVEAGNFDLERQHSWATGEYLAHVVDGWQPVFGHWVRRPDGGREFQALQADLPPPQVEHLVIPCPSGELLFCDWPRIAEFTAVVDADKSDESLASRAGLRQSSARYAKHGFAAVFVGNSSPEVFERGGQMIVASVGERFPWRSPQVRSIGSVCTDLWWATAIDRQVLEGLITPALGPRGAHGAVDEWLASSWGRAAVCHRVPAGELHLYHGGGHEMSQFECDEVSQENLDPLYCVLARQPLSWRRRDVERTPESLVMRPRERG